MSADNWAKCPKCSADLLKKKNAAILKLGKSYGNIPAEEYLLKMASVQEMPTEAEASLREDYEVGIWEGRFSVIYSGGCNGCGFKFDYKHEEPIK